TGGRNSGERRRGGSYARSGPGYWSICRGLRDRRAEPRRETRVQVRSPTKGPGRVDRVLRTAPRGNGGRAGAAGRKDRRPDRLPAAGGGGGGSRADPGGCGA